MSVIENGTRVSATQAQTVGASTRTVSQGYSRDVGLAPNVVGPVVFTANPPAATLAGAFGSFPVGEQVLVENTNLNNGLFYVTAVTANALTLSPPPKPENPAAATVRTA